MKLVLQILGGLLVFCGGFFALQGAGVIMWPADSFMLTQGRWILYGLIIAGAGAVLLWLARRRV